MLKRWMTWLRRKYSLSCYLWLFALPDRYNCAYYPEWVCVKCAYIHSQYSYIWLLGILQNAPAASGGKSKGGICSQVQWEGRRRLWDRSSVTTHCNCASVPQNIISEPFKENGWFALKRKKKKHLGGGAEVASQNIDGRLLYGSASWFSHIAHCFLTGISGKDVKSPLRSNYTDNAWGQSWNHFWVRLFGAWFLTLSRAAASSTCTKDNSKSDPMAKLTALYQHNHRHWPYGSWFPPFEEAKYEIFFWLGVIVFFTVGNSQK